MQAAEERRDGIAERGRMQLVALLSWKYATIYLYYCYLKCCTCSCEAHSLGQSVNGAETPSGCLMPSSDVDLTVIRWQLAVAALLQNVSKRDMLVLHLLQ
jgi:hypothetical protein